MVKSIFLNNILEEVKKLEVNEVQVRGAVNWVEGKVLEGKR